MFIIGTHQLCVGGECMIFKEFTCKMLQKIHISYLQTEEFWPSQLFQPPLVTCLPPLAPANQAYITKNCNKLFENRTT